MKRATFLSGCVLTLLLAAGVLQADYTFPPFDLTVGYEQVTHSLDTVGVPAGPYSGYVLTVLWDVNTNGPQAAEAVWQLELPGHVTLLADPGPSEDDPQSPPQTLSWSGEFTQTYQGGAALKFLARQTFYLGEAVWSDVSLTLISGTVAPAVPPAAVEVGALSPGVTAMEGMLDSNGVVWYRFTVPDVTEADCDTLRIDALGWDLSGGTYRQGDDPEIALYDAAGLLGATHDDVDQVGNELRSALAFGANEGDPVATSGGLWAGEYYLAVAGFDAEFGLSGFEVTPDSAVEGLFVLFFTLGEPAFDCDSNGVADVCDISSGSGSDINTNGVPDECEDCNENFILDPEEIAAGTANDCNANGVPDFCDVTEAASRDCNANLVPDECEVSEAVKWDRNGNGYPDECEVAAGTGADCNENGIPDDCDAVYGTAVFVDDFSEDVLDPSRWVYVGGEPTAPTVEAIYVSAWRSLFVGDDLGTDTVETVEIDLAGTAAARVAYYLRSELYNSDGDELHVSIWDGSDWQIVFTHVADAEPPAWEAFELWLPPAALHSGFRLRFHAQDRGDLYWFVDDLEVAVFSVDCNGNETPDECDIAQGTSDDCNSNGAIDDCEIAAGTSPDFDGDGLMDECDADMDDDGLLNEVDVCDDTPLGAAVNPSGGPMGDIDDNCAVDLDDYYYFEICIAICGPGGDPVFQDCADVFDFDGDGDVDLADFAGLQGAFGG